MARAAASRAGDIDPATPGRRRIVSICGPAESPPTVGSTARTRCRAGLSRAGATANITQAAAASVIPASMLLGASRAASAAAERGRARNPTPNALTMAAIPSPVVSATAPTDKGIASATRVMLSCGAWMRLCNRSHSLTKPAPSGKPEAPSAAMPNMTVVTGIRRARPPSLSRSRSPVAASTDPAARKPSVLKAAWLSRCRSAAVNAMAATVGAPEDVRSAAAPRASVISPMFSVVE